MNSEVIVVPVVFIVFYLAFKALLTHRTRMKMIERGMPPESVKDFFAVDGLHSNPNISQFNWTKLGLVLFFIGVINLVSDYFYLDDSMRFSALMIAIGTVIIISPKLERMLTK